ncbi:MAG: restriction endonuclease [Minisyncoccia bacterium]
MQFGIIVIIGLAWLVIKVFEGLSGGVSNIAQNRKNKEAFEIERSTEYSDRFIDTTKNLYERNIDIIESFTKRVTARSEDNPYSYSGRYSSKNYFFDNLTRDCINEIALAENNYNVRPNTEYLSNWKPKVSQEWQLLATEIESAFADRKKELQAEKDIITARNQAEDNERAEKERKLRMERWEQEETIKEVERNVKRYRAEFAKVKAERKDSSQLKSTRQRKEKGSLCIEDIPLILSADLHPWDELEKDLVKQPHKTKPFPSFSSKVESNKLTNLASIYALNNEIAEFNKTIEKDIQEGNEAKAFFKAIRSGYEKGEKEDVIKRFNFVIDNITVPASIPKVWDIDFDVNEGIAIVEIKLPDVVHNQVLKEVHLKRETVEKPLTIKEGKELIPNIHPSVMLRIAYEIFRNDDADKIKLLVLNGWVEFDDPATGNLTRTYTASLATTKEQIVQLKLSKLDPLSAFLGLKGKSAGKLIDIIPVSPVMSLDKKDKRFIKTKEVIGTLDAQTNLASMDWQDFENLIAELFQKEFSEEGTEIKLTQSSRDKGVDAIVFNPDPIRGGKYVIQAKRYTNTVDVSAVRDLVAVVAHEGASRGILVTTSTFGADAYAFVQNKPITLLDGAKLLGLLEKHGYKFRVNLAEARKLFPANNKY